jgi:hypothetical protein
MSGKQLRAEYERLARRIADALAHEELPESESRLLLSQLGSLTGQSALRLRQVSRRIAR